MNFQTVLSQTGKVIGTVWLALIVGVPALVMVMIWWSDISLYFTSTRDGNIIVNSPSIYTRQRLVNDRLSQTSWLQEQLNATRPDQEFRSIDEVRSGLFIR